MLVKLTLLLVLGQVVCFSHGGVISRDRREKKCAPLYTKCEKSEDCCSPNTYCSEDNRVCQVGTDPGGPTPTTPTGPPVNPFRNTFPGTPQCSKENGPCKNILECCAPLNCDNRNKCVRGSKVSPPGLGK